MAEKKVANTAGTKIAKLEARIAYLEALFEALEKRDGAVGQIPLSIWLDEMGVEKP